MQASVKKTSIAVTIEAAADATYFIQLRSVLTDVFARFKATFKTTFPQKAGFLRSAMPKAAAGPTTETELHVLPPSDARPLGTRLKGRLGGKVAAAVDASGQPLVELVTADGQPLPLPEPDAAGVIRLKGWCPPDGFPFGVVTLRSVSGAPLPPWRLKLVQPKKGLWAKWLEE